MKPDLFPTVELTDASNFAGGMIDVTPEFQEEALDQADEMDAQEFGDIAEDETAQAASVLAPDPLDQLEI